MIIPQDLVGNLIARGTINGGNVRRDTQNTPLTDKESFFHELLDAHRKFEGIPIFSGAAPAVPVAAPVPAMAPPPPRPTAPPLRSGWVAAAPRAFAAAVAPPPPAPSRPLDSWSYDFLEYVPGFTTFQRITRGVLTGPMSGCYIFVYTYEGRPYVAHCGTDGSQSTPDSLRAKRAWLKFIERNEVRSITGGTPIDYYDDAAYAEGRKFGSEPQIACYVGLAGDMYALLVVVDKTSPRPSGINVPLTRILACKPMKQRPWAAISTMRTWTDAWQPRTADVKGTVKYYTDRVDPETKTPMKPGYHLANMRDRFSPKK